MRKLVLLIIAIVMILSMSSIGYATEGTLQDSTNNQIGESVENEDALLIVPLGTDSKTVSEYDKGIARVCYITVRKSKLYCG